MNVLVTGANGFLGRHIVSHLKKQGYFVKAMVRKTSNTQGMDKEILVYADLLTSDFEDITRNVDIVIHAAGIVKAKNMYDFYRIKLVCSSWWSP